MSAADTSVAGRLIALAARAATTSRSTVGGTLPITSREPITASSASGDLGAWSSVMGGFGRHVPLGADVSRRSPVLFGGPLPRRSSGWFQPPHPTLPEPRLRLRHRWRSHLRPGPAPKLDGVPLLAGSADVTSYPRRVRFAQIACQPGQPVLGHSVHQPPVKAAHLRHRSEAFLLRGGRARRHVFFFFFRVR